MIILIFLYKVLDDTKLTNSKFETHIYKKDEINHLYKIFAEDVAESTGTISISQDRDKNQILIFESNNSFHQPFYRNITYMISSNNNLVRIESLDKFTKEKTPIGFYDKSFIDILVDNIERFVVIKKDDKVIFIVKQKEKKEMIFSTFIMED